LWRLIESITSAPLSHLDIPDPTPFLDAKFVDEASCAALTDCVDDSAESPA
jgi:hypothetical protein